MEKITGKHLLKSGFKKFVEPTVKNEKGYHYYSYDVNNSCLLISCANDEKVNGGYTVEFFNILDLIFYDFKDLKKQLEIINKIKN